jgi:acyl-CoA reductase-like NAD-dependent aldehyde dehydrogenase
MTKSWDTSQKLKILVVKSSLAEPVRYFDRVVSPPLQLTPFPGDDSRGYFVQPTVILTKDPQSVTMVEEIFGPVITVRVFHSR